jgi:sulfate permease, SulP family
VPAADYLKLAGSALGVMLVGFAEGLGAARTYAARDGYQISPDRELVGLGAANLAAGLSSGMVVNGSLSKTAVNGSAGARTQASGLTVAVLTVITLLFLTGLFEDLPEATLSAVVIAALIELVDYKALRALYRAYSLRLGKIYGLARRRGVRLVLAGEIGQVRDMLAAVSGPDRSPEYHRTVHDAVDSARTGPGRAGAAGTGA